MKIKLINGRFPIQEAEELLIGIYKVKINFHYAKIYKSSRSEEDVKHSEYKIKVLEENLRNAIKRLKNCGLEYCDIEATVDLSLPTV